MTRRARGGGERGAGWASEEQANAYVGDLETEERAALAPCHAATANSRATDTEAHAAEAAGDKANCAMPEDGSDVPVSAYGVDAAFLSCAADGSGVHAAVCLASPAPSVWDDGRGNDERAAMLRQPELAYAAALQRVLDDALAAEELANAAGVFAAAPAACKSSAMAARPHRPFYASDRVSYSAIIHLCLYIYI